MLGFVYSCFKTSDKGNKSYIQLPMQVLEINNPSSFKAGEIIKKNLKFVFMTYK